MPDLRQNIQSALQAFSTQPLRAASLALLDTLGYQSERTILLDGSRPQAFLDLANNSGAKFDAEKALLPEWKSADILFQLTDDDLASTSSLFKETDVKAGLLRSYLFFAIELKGSDYPRGKLSAIARQINRVFPMPVMVFLKHGEKLSIAVINRRQNKVHSDKDVLEKVTLIRDITLTSPHRGHQDILASFALPLLKHPKRLAIDNFDTLHECWEKIFNVELLNQNFYNDIANWFFWAKKYAHFPLYDESQDRYELFNDSDKVREHEAKNLIRLLTRVLFVWFIKQRGLVHESLFNATDLERDILKKFDPESKDTNYYKTILQNLFFATLNAEHRKREFRKDGQHQNTTTLLRYQDNLKNPDAFLKLLEDNTPFLNGGLFDCLDRPHPSKLGKNGGKVIIYEDGFSDRKDNPLYIPDFLFFGKPRTVDLSGDEAYGIPAKRSETVRGLIDILDSYKFTIVENTPIDQEVALDPELLGQVFENLLASYNNETKTTARKQTGSFYTPRGIVDYMVDESLKAHLCEVLVKECSLSREEANEGLEILFAYTEKEHVFSPSETTALITAIDRCKILDPACGSGAFPMGALQKLVHILSKLDPGDELWERRQLEKVDAVLQAAQQIEDSTFREKVIEDANRQKEDIEEAFGKNELGYGRKLYLIENCLYGVDIQSIATQVSKLRFFISLIVDQKVDIEAKNFGVRPLPNLESKFVTADTLIRIERPEEDLYQGHSSLFDIAGVAPLQKRLKEVRHNLFSAKTPRTKDKYRKEDKALRDAIADELELNGWESEAARNLARWDPYNQNATAPYFDPEWMFGETAFDVIIGNPPYIQIQKFPTEKKSQWEKQKFQTYAATADIYCLFYERGQELLKPGGVLTYITSNKWMRAGYGEKLRGFLSKEVDTDLLLDFGMAQNFGAATTYTCITRFFNRPSKDTLQTCYASDDKAAMASPQRYFEENAVVQNDLSSLPWVVLPAERFKIKKHVESMGVPLKKWDIHIYRGVLTGFNDAFYIPQKERDRMVREDERCAKYLVPLLRGRHVERYATKWDGTWMIATFPILNLKFSDLPKPIREHLEQHRERLEPKPPNWSSKKWNGRKAGAYEWFETQDVIGYHEEFRKPKIVYPNMTTLLPFVFDDNEKFVINDKGFIITSNTSLLPYLTAVLNSHLFRCCFRDNFPELMGNTYEVRKIFIEKIPIKKPTPTESALFQKLVPMVQLAKREGMSAVAGFLEDLIDACVMECYFRDHMAERDLLFHATVAPHLAAYDPEASADQQRGFFTHLHQTLNAPNHPIRNSLDRITSDSPDLLAVIKQEGRV
jgi:type I restriction-modification system DNA methylase subunit